MGIDCAGCREAGGRGNRQLAGTHVALQTCDAIAGDRPSARLVGLSWRGAP